MLFLWSDQALCDSLDRQRIDFLQAEKLIVQNNAPAFEEISTRLKAYPLYPYLQYQWIKGHLEESDKVQAFLTAYQETRYADLIRSKWLEYLSKQERWLDFINNYQGSENTSLRCQFYWANYKTGNTLQALNEAKNLWLTGDSQPAACEPLLTALSMSAMLTPELIWQRFELALKKDNVNLANYVKTFMDKADQDIASYWLQTHKNPTLIQDANFNIQQSKYHNRIFAHGIDRMIKQNLDSALFQWDANKSRLSLEKSISDKVERKLAMALALNKDKRAYGRLKELSGDDADIREWKVRAALLEQNWQHVADALALLTFEEQQLPQWQYWQARVLVATKNNQEDALAIYHRVAKDRGFYGFLAADLVDKPFNLLDKPVLSSDSELDILSQQNDFQAAKEFDLLNRQMEARRQWWFAINKLPKEKRLAAAKLAQRWHWDQIAIMTLVKADYWDDLTLRFPLSFIDHVQDNANKQSLDPAIVFGLIRQESMLDNNAKSAVGALGLMQIMPKTGKQIAMELNEKWQSEQNLLNPGTNIRYGAYYLKQLINRFHGNLALAAAAYNAGPNRVNKWLPKDQPISADLWIETIPFKETRKYVASVLSYAIIYQHRIHSNLLKLRNLLPDVQPG